MKTYSIQDLKEISKIMTEKKIDLRKARETFDISSGKGYNKDIRNHKKNNQKENGK